MKAYVARVELACPLVRTFKATLFLWALQKVRTFQSNSVVFDLCEFVPDCARLNRVPQNDSEDHPLFGRPHLQTHQDGFTP